MTLLGFGEILEQEILDTNGEITTSALKDTHISVQSAEIPKVLEAKISNTGIGIGGSILFALLAVGLHLATTKKGVLRGIVGKSNRQDDGVIVNGEAVKEQVRKEAFKDLGDTGGERGFKGDLKRYVPFTGSTDTFGVN